MMGDRRGIMAFNYSVMIVRIIFLLIVLIVCVMLVSVFVNQKFDVTEVQGELIIDGLLYGTGGVGCTDPVTGRSYPGVICMDQLSASELDAGLFFPDNRVVSARITVKDRDGRIIDEVYYNREWYENWEPLEGVPGRGGVDRYTRTLPVILREGAGSTSSGIVEFDVLQPKSARVK